MSGRAPVREAATQMVRLLEGLEREGTSVVDLVRRGRPPEPWTIFPDEYGIFDRRTRCQFYFHAHEGASHEAGHFHTVRLFDDHTAHLVAISIGERGWPQRLFTLNLWAIGDAWEPPEALKRYARSFRIGAGRGEAPLVRLVNLVFRAFVDEIAWLQDEKQRVLDAYRATTGTDPFEDRALEVLSAVDIDVRARAAAATTGAIDTVGERQPIRSPRSAAAREDL